MNQTLVNRPDDQTIVKGWIKEHKVKKGSFLRMERGEGAFIAEVVQIFSDGSLEIVNIGDGKTDFTKKTDKTITFKKSTVLLAKMIRERRLSKSCGNLFMDNFLDVVIDYGIRDPDD